jgi:hypothetical protein
MRKTDFDTRLIIHRSRQIFLLVMVIVVAFVFALMIIGNNRNDFPWYVLVLPISGVGLLFLLIPMTEIWEYKPWQSKARRIEQQER